MVTGTATLINEAFAHLMHSAFDGHTVVLRSNSHDIEVELPPGAAVASPAVPGPDDARWFVPGVDEPAAGPSGPSAGLRALQQAAAALAEQTASGSPADVAALMALSDQLRGVALGELAEMTATGSHLASGAPTAATWLRDARTVTDVSARAEVRLAETLRSDLPELAALLRQGKTTLEHVRAVVAGTRGLDRQVVRDSDAAICKLVETLDPASVRALLRERAEAVSPELGRESERRAHDRRGLTVDEVGSSGSILGGALGVEDTQIVLLALDLATRADREAGDPRSLPQRRADVLVQWARDWVARQTDGQVREDLRSTRAQLLLTCTLEQLARAQQTIADAPALFGSRIPAAGGFGPGLLISNHVLRRLACDASVSLLVQPDTAGDTTPDLGPNPLGLDANAEPAPDPLYVGRAARIVTAAQWRALVVRDRHCVVKGCRRRPLQCEAHHVRHWLDGGTTDLDNMILLCFQHHHDHHDRGHDLRHRDGRWITSTGWGAQAPP